MGLRCAIANGNWSDSSTWEGGILPSATDVAATNGFTVNIDQDIVVEGLTNAVHYPSAIPPMIYYNAPGGVATSSGEYSGQYPAWKAFNINSSTSDSWIHTNGIPAGWLAYEFKAPKVINQYNIVATYSNAVSSSPRDWTFEGWDGGSWIVLDTVVGNTQTSYIGNFINTSAYKKYRINITANNGGSYTSVSTMYMGVSNDPTTTSVGTGSFTIEPGVSVTCTQVGLLAGGSPDLITINNPGDYYFNSNIVKAGSISALNIQADADVYIVGDILSVAGSNSNAIESNTYSRIYITGEIKGALSTSNNISGCISLNNLAEAYITGNVTSNNADDSINNNSIIKLDNGSVCEITGNVYHNDYASRIIANNGGILSIIGTLDATCPNLQGYDVVYSNWQATAVNMLSGPFIFSKSGHSPIFISRFFFIRTPQSYIEYMDDSGSGLLPPNTQGEPTRLVSPDTVSDSPNPSDVRQGVSYSLNTLTGTMAVPSADSVAAGIQVDSTIGTAALDPNSMWDVPIDSINAEGSVGKRMKNISTIETTGDQLKILITN